MTGRMVWLMGIVLTLVLGGGVLAQDPPPQPGSTSPGAAASGFAVTEVLPADGVAEVAPETAITVIFNRPVVPLTVEANQTDLPNPLTFSPQVAGEGEWLNTSIYVFRPEGAFGGGLTYTVTVDDLTSFDGTAVEPFSWSFTTDAPRVVEVNTQSQQNSFPLDEAIQITFNQPMSRESFETAFALYDADGVSVAGSPSWNTDNTVFNFTPDESLQLDTLYRVTLDGAVATTQYGGALLGGGLLEWSFLTVAAPAIVSTSPLDGAAGIGSFEGVVLNFLTPMNPDTIEGRISVEPEISLTPYGFYSTYNDSYRLNFEAAPSTTYTVTVEPGMEDIYGNTIDRGLTFSYTTRPLDPQVALQIPGEVAVYDAARESTELYVAYRNVQTANLQLFSVETERFASLFANEPNGIAYYYEPQPGTLLREWTIDASTLPQNVRRYDLLTLGESGAASCPGALPSRLAAGDMGVVTTEPDPLRARSEPPGGEVVELMYRDYRFEVVSGPRCIQGIPWFEITLRDGERGWIAESVDGEYLVDVAAAADAGNIPVTTLDGGPLEPGIYHIRASSPQINDGGNTRHMMVVATANVTLKRGPDSVFAWVTDLHTGEPLASVPVQLWAFGAGVVASGTTDGDGMATLDYTPSDTDSPNWVVAVVDDEEVFGVGADRWTNGVEPWRFNVYYDLRPLPLASYLYTDRPVYRPDQPVYFRGIVRDKADVTYTRPSFDTVRVWIHDADNEVIYDENVMLDSYGAFSDTLMLAEDAALGGYQIGILDPFAEDNRSIGQLSFTVAEYRLPEYSVAVGSVVSEGVVGDDLTGTVAAEYFFGGGVSGGEVEYNVQRAAYRFRYTGEGRYSFEDNDPYNSDSFYFYSFPSQVASGSVTADANGEATVSLPTDESGELTFEATVRDETGVSVSGRTTLIVHPSEVYVGVGLGQYINRAGDAINVNLTAVDWDSAPVRNQFIDVTVEQWSYVTVQETDADGNTAFRTEVQRTPVTSETVVTGADGLVDFTFTPEDGGIYKVLATTEDEEGREVAASQVVWVSGQDYVNWRVNNDNTLQMVADADEYNIGDTAQILITSPFQGEAEALVTVERNGVLAAEHITLTSNSIVYDLPITEDYAPNVFVSVMLVKGVDETNPLATFRYGVTQLNVETTRKVVNVEITPDVEDAQPGDTVTYTLRTTDYAGEAVAAQVGVGLTDLASLSLMPPNSGPILNAFYSEQSLSVQTSTPLSINGDETTAYVREVVKGGGGGGGGGGGVFAIREEFLDTAYWNATLETDADGTAQFAVTLPDNLTTWRLDARAITAGDEGTTFRVGQQTFDLRASLPLLVRPVTPRFFVVGDEAVLASVVNNNTGEEQEVTAFLEIAGVTIQGDNEQVQVIPSGERARFEWTVTVDNVEAVDATFFAATAGQEFTDASKPPLGQGEDSTLPVYRYLVPETVGTAGLLREAGETTEGVLIPASLATGVGELTLNVNTSLASVTTEGLTYLRNYPHQCTEQTVSRFLPNIVTYQALDKLGLSDPALKTALDEQVRAGLQILYTRQNIDGGWGWFSRDASNNLVTAYVLMGLFEAQDAGYAVSADVVLGAQMYLTDLMNSPLARVPELGGAGWQYDREAFILYALSRATTPDAARAANLFEDRARLSADGAAFLAMAMHSADQTDPRISVLMNDIMNAASTSATGTFWSSASARNWSTQTRTTSVVLEALVTISPESDLIPNVVRYLVSARTADAWETTQETAWAVMSLTDWMVASDERAANYDYRVAVNGEALLEATADAATLSETTTLSVDVADLLADEINEIAFGRGDGGGNLYYTAFLEASLPVTEVEPLDSGVIVARRYVTADGTTTDSAAVGDVVEVRITVVAPQDLHYVMIEDPVPAGMEPINPDLLTSAQIGTRPDLENLDNGWGWWWFSSVEFRDEKAVLYSTYLPAGTYEYVYSLRATIPGTYNVIPTTAQEFYFPDVYGRGAGSMFTVTSAE